MSSVSVSESVMEAGPATAWEAGDLPVADILTDRGTQMRPWLDQVRVAEFAGVIAEGDGLEPLKVVVTDDGPVLVDGFHRLEAHKKAGRERAAVVARPGTIRDAVLEAAGANARGSLPRCPTTRRRSVLALLDDAEWREKSTKWLARAAGVSFAFAEKVRVEHERDTGQSRPDVVTGEDGIARPARAPARPVEPSPETEIETEPEAGPPTPGPTSAPTARASGPLVTAAPGERRREAEREEASRWLETLPCRSQLPADRVNGFDREALAYRELDSGPHFAAVLTAMRRMLGTSRLRQDGPFSTWMAAVAHHRHPRDWKMCLECTGTGALWESSCRKCCGHGYLM